MENRPGQPYVDQITTTIAYNMVIIAAWGSWESRSRGGWGDWGWSSNIRYYDNKDISYNKHV